MAEDSHRTRLALLEAGVEALKELTPSALVTALRTREIARRAGVSAPTFFHHFRTVDEYATALVDHVFSLERRRLTSVVTEGLREAQQLQLPAEQSIAYHERDLHQVAADPDHRLRMGLWALGGSAVDAAFRRFTDEVDRQILPQAQALHDVWGREVRPPLDLTSYLALQLSILTGAATRHLIDPSVMTPARYARAAAALSMVMLRPRGDRRTMDDRLSEMNYLPGARASLGAATGRRDATRARVIDAAAELFAEYGYEATSIARIARTADVHVATLYDHFESKAHLGLTLFDLQAAVHLAGPHPAGSGSPTDALRSHLEGVALFAVAHADLAKLYVTSLVCGSHPVAFDDVLHAPTAKLVAAALDGQPDIEPTADRTTDHVLVTTIGGMLRHPGDGPGAAATAALRYLTGG